MFCTELCACSIEKYCFNFPGHLFPNLQSFDKHLLCFTSACVQTRTFGGGSNARSNLANPGSTSKNRETYQRKRDERDKSGTESRPEGVYRELVWVGITFDLKNQNKKNNAYLSVWCTIQHNTSSGWLNEKGFGEIHFYELYTRRWLICVSISRDCFPPLSFFFWTCNPFVGRSCLTSHFFKVLASNIHK